MARYNTFKDYLKSNEVKNNGDYYTCIHIDSYKYDPDKSFNVHIIESLPPIYNVEEARKIGKEYISKMLVENPEWKKHFMYFAIEIGDFLQGTTISL